MANKPISIDEAGHREEKKKHFRKIIYRRGKGKNTTKSTEWQESLSYFQ